MANLQQELHDVIVPRVRAEIATAVNSHHHGPKIAVEWKSFRPDALAYLENAVLQRLIMAISATATDELAKTLIKKHIKEITITNTPGKPGKVDVSIEKSVLALSGDYAKGLSGTVSNYEIADAMVAALDLKYERALKKLKEEQIPHWTNEARTKLGMKDFVLEADFPSLQTAGAVEYFDNQCGYRILRAFEMLADPDNYGPDAPKKIKKVIFSQLAAEKKISFDHPTGVLHIWQPIDRELTPELNPHSYNDIYDYLIETLNLKYIKELPIMKKQMEVRGEELQKLLKNKVNYEIDITGFSTDDEVKYVDNVTGYRVLSAFEDLDAGKKEIAGKRLKTIHIKCIKNKDEKKMIFDNNGERIRFEVCYGVGLSGAFSNYEILAELKENYK